MPTVLVTGPTVMQNKLFLPSSDWSLIQFLAIPLSGSNLRQVVHTHSCHQAVWTGTSQSEVTLCG